DDAEDASSPAPTDAAPSKTAERLEAAKEQLDSLTARYKRTYPDIPRTERLIRDLEDQLKAENAAMAAIGADGSGRAAVAAAARQETRQKRIKELQSQVTQLDDRIAANEQNEARLRGQSTDFQQRIDQVPQRESEMTELTRDYGTLQTV